MKPGCGVAALLRPGGPVQVPLRQCCVAALLGADGMTTDVCAANQVDGPGGIFADPVEATVRVGDPVDVSLQVLAEPMQASS